MRSTLVWTLRAVLGVVALALLYVGTAVVMGLVPVNTSWRQAEQGTAVYVITNGVHTSFIVPRGEGDDDLLRFVPFEDASGDDCPYVEFGWGDRAFYLETPRWSDLRVTTALNAMLLPSSTVVHVVYWWSEPRPGERVRRVVLRPEEYGRLLDHVREAFALDAEGRARRILGARYHDRDAFFEGAGSYSLLYTCNDWTNTGLKAAGVRTALWSPFDKAIMYHLPASTDD
ncbi:MAG: TIGR02117 family protein [Planctomycetota bacterium]